MAAPVFVNIGLDVGQSFGTTLAAPLPASRVNGNLLIAAFFTAGFKSGGFNITVSSGWTILDFVKTDDGSSCVAYRVVDGTETDCTFTWDANQSGRARCAQYSGTTGIGAFSSTVNATNIAAMGDSGVTTTAADSRIAAILGGYVGATTITDPPNYTVDAPDVGGTGGTTLWASQAKVAAGTPSDAVSATGGQPSRSWTVYSVELLSTAPPVVHSLAADFTDDGGLEAAVAMAVDFAADFTDDGGLDAQITLLGIHRLAADFTDENGLAAVLSTLAPVPDIPAEEALPPVMVSAIMS